MEENSAGDNCELSMSESHSNIQTIRNIILQHQSENETETKLQKAQRMRSVALLDASINVHRFQ